MNYTYFLAANSSRGFYSIYDSFPPGKDVFLHIIKGGPGSGKSGFMRRIGAEAEKRDMDVHYILCSGDPGSLDGLYIPAIKQAWADGTRPHVREPDYYGADSDYVNLGDFFIPGLSRREIDYVNLYSDSYRQKYASAYKLLSAAAELGSLNSYDKFPEDTEGEIAGILKNILKIHPISPNSESRSVSVRFLSCIGCMGDYRLYDELNKLCKSFYVIRNFSQTAPLILDILKKLGQREKESLILCPSALCPEKLSAVIFPERALAFTDDSWELREAEHLDLNYLIKPSPEAEDERLLKLRQDIMELAFLKLREAREFHDLLEAQYKPHIDFSALSKFTELKIRELFK